MVSGFFTSPCDHSRIFSGDASEMRIALKESGSLGFSKKLKMSRIGVFLFLCCYGDELLRLWDAERIEKEGKKIRKFCFLIFPIFLFLYSSAAWSGRTVPGSISSTLRQSAWSSLMRTLKLSG